MHPAASLNCVHPFPYSCLFSSNRNTSALGSLPPLHPPPIAAALTFLPDGLLSGTGHSTRPVPNPHPLCLALSVASVTSLGVTHTVWLMVCLSPDGELQGQRSRLSCSLMLPGVSNGTHHRACAKHTPVQRLVFTVYLQDMLLSTFPQLI